MEQRTSLTEIIEYINPGDLNYQEWINVGTHGAAGMPDAIMQGNVKRNGKASQALLLL